MSAPTTGVVGSRLQYSFVVFNAGPDAVDGLLRITLPTGFERAPSPEVGHCTGTTVLECKPVHGLFYPPGAPFDSRNSFPFAVRPTQAGTFTIKAIVTSDASDPNPANNEATVTVTITAATPKSGTPAKLTGTVGPGSSISLNGANGSRLRTTKAGAYALAVRDRSTRDNFHLTGPGVNVKTGVASIGTRTFRITLQSGKMYRYRSDPHPKLGGSFRAT